uniref:Uncharacterized protein n=1 Tax=Arundo donax TaxID=35708 RepID=A0A0A9BYQ0_ARUDO
MSAVTWLEIPSNKYSPSHLIFMS